jgi:hypothetical protein
MLRTTLQSIIKPYIMLKWVKLRPLLEMNVLLDCQTFGRVAE